MRRRLAAATFVLGFAAPARAQDVTPPASDPSRPGEVEPLRAQQLFDEALTLADQNRWAEACPKFRESLTADAGVGTLLNVAFCSSREGKALDAAREYRRVLELNEKTADAERRRVVEGQAKQALKELAARLARVTFVVSPVRPDLRLELDGVSRKPGAAIEVEIGDHVAVVQAEGFRRSEVKVHLVGGQDATIPIALSLLDDKTAKKPEVVARSGASGLLTAGWITGLVGAAGLTTGAALVSVAADRASEIRDECGAGAAPPNCPLGSASVANELASEGQALAIGGYVSFGVGGAAVATAVALFLVDATQPAEAPVAVSFTLAPEAVGVSFGGRFE